MLRRSRVSVTRKRSIQRRIYEKEGVGDKTTAIMHDDEWGSRVD